MLIQIDETIYNAETILKIELNENSIIIHYQDSSKITHTFENRSLAKSIFNSIKKL